MITSLTDWVAFLQKSGTLVGLPFMIGGLGLMLFGWRMWKACVVISFGLIGMGLGSYFADGQSAQLLYAAVAGSILAVASYFPARFSLAILGGLIGGGFVIHTVDGWGVHGPVMWVVGALALFSCTALAFINRQLIVIGVTGFLGAALLVSGLATLAMTSHTLYGTFRFMASNSAIVLPFVILVPTIMSCFYQVAEVHRTNSEL